MSYKAIFTKSFIKSVKKLEKKTRERIINAIKEILENPYTGIPLTGLLKGLWKKRIGKYRIIYKIYEKEEKVAFVDIGLRKSIYKNW